MNKEAIKQVANQLFFSEDVQNIIDDLKYGNRYEASISIFSRRNLELNLDISVIKQVIECLNKEYAEYIFNLGRGLGSPELYIANRKIKIQNETTHAVKTMQDMADALNDLGIQTDILYHVNPDMLISDEEFENDLSIYKKLLSDYIQKKTDTPSI
ncbi:hypothetical protein CPR19088_GLDEOEPO_00807 [Companilactobacillus paralimentarius]